MLQEIDAFTLVFIGSGLIFLVVAIFLIIYYRYANRLMGATVKNNQLKLDHQKDLLKNEIDAIDKERERLARDLHDEVGALLSYISMNLSVKTEKDTNKELINSINDNKKNLDEAIEKIRHISHSLLPPTLDLFGLQVAIEEFINSLKTNLKFDFSSSFDLTLLPKDHALHLYRLIMEFVNNSVKHSKGDTIKIQFTKSNASYHILIADNGIGFDYEKAILTSGMGLKNIESRLNSLEAEHTLDSNKNGTQVLIKLSKSKKS